MQKLNLDKQTIALIILAGVLLLEVFLFLPLGIGKVGALNKEISLVQAKIKNIETDWPKKDKYVRQNDELKTNIQTLKMSFLLAQQEANALSFISSESEKFNIKIEVLKPSKLKDFASTKFGSFKYLPIVVRGSGKFHDAAKFFEYLQNSKYFFEITEIDIFPGAVGNSMEMIICGLIKE
jgi:hypothetical protein